MIVGLGNPGGEYKGTRHNVGFDVVDRLAEKNRIRVDRGKHRALVGQGEIGSVPVALVKPLTYMNLSGQSVAPLARDFSVKPERILVLADDLDLPVGKLRLRLNGSAGGHNGHKSLIASLQTADYPRLKIGIGKAPRQGTIDHVLGAFEREERETMLSALDACTDIVKAVVTQSWEEGLRKIEDWNKRLDI